MEALAGGDIDRGPTIMAIMWAQAAISCIVVAMRFWARITIKALGRDDWVMLCTLIKYVLLLVPNQSRRLLTIILLVSSFSVGLSPSRLYMAAIGICITFP